jgi:hypothetical protein
VLLLFEVNHRRFQAWPELPLGCQARRQHAQIARLAVRTNDLVLLRLKDQRVDDGEFRDLAALNVYRRDVLQIRLAGLTARDGHRDYTVGLVYQRAHAPGMPEGRSMLLFPRLGKRGFRVTGRRLGRIPGSGGRLFEAGEFRFKLGDFGLLLGDKL